MAYVPHDFSKKKKKRILQEKEKDLPVSGLQRKIVKRKAATFQDLDVLSAIQTKIRRTWRTKRLASSMQTT